MNNRLPEHILSSSPCRQTGFALMTVLIIMVLVSLMLSGMVYRQSLTIKRSGAILHQSQAFAVQWGMEHWVKKGLTLDAKLTKVDNLKELWAQPMIAVPFAGGEVSGQLFDQQAKLNINNLVLTSGEDQKQWKVVFNRYLTQNHLASPKLDVIVDWMDNNQEPLPQGAESDYYLTLNPPYRSGDQILVQIDTLQLMKGIKPKDFHIMKRDMTALPNATKINVNTASKPVLLALSDAMTPKMCDAWLNYRKTAPAETVQAFNNFLATKGLKTPIASSLINVSSSYFMLSDHIQYGETRLSMRALFARTVNKQTQLLQRWIMPLDADANTNDQHNDNNQ